VDGAQEFPSADPDVRHNVPPDAFVVASQFTYSLNRKAEAPGNCFSYIKSAKTTIEIIPKITS